jgi:peptide/nickel transport system substrate-binding protein
MTDPPRRKRFMLPVILLTLTVVLAGCGGGSGGGDGSAEGGEGPVLTVYNGASGQFTENFNPFSPTTNTPAQGMIFETLMFFNQGKVDDVQPLLATEYSWSDEGKTVTFTLRDGVKWSDGKPFTAEDVVFTFDLIRDRKALNTNGLPITGAKADDATHVSVSFSRPAYTDLWFVAGQTWILPKHIWSTITDPETNAVTKPVGTGPFVLESFSPQNYVVTKNPAYWQQGKPEIGGLRFVSFSGNQAATSALIAGQVDWMGGFIPDIENVYAKKDPDNAFLNTPLMITTLMANLDKAPTNDPAVRQAIYWGMDRDQLNRTAFSGYSTPTTPALVVLPRDEQWIDPQVAGQKPGYDAAKAERLLQEAGYTKGADGIYAKGGQRLAMTVKVVTGYTDQIAALETLQQQLRKIGIELQPQQEAYASFTANRGNGEFDLVIDNAYGGPEPYYLYNRYLNSQNTAPIGQKAEPNYARYRNPKVDDALARLGATDDEAQRKEAYAAIQQEVVRDMPYVPMLQSSSFTEFRTAKVTGWPSTDNLYALPLVYQRPDVAVVATRLKVK